MLDCHQPISRFLLGLRQSDVLRLAAMRRYFSEHVAVNIIAGKAYLDLEAVLVRDYTALKIWRVFPQSKEF